MFPTNLPEETPCIFCKIIKGEIPSYKIYEDKNYIAFLDINPLNPGHTLVIPKEHFRWVWDSPDIGKYFEVVQKIVKALRTALETEWVVAAIIGEAVEHAHVQLIPRFKDDGHGGAINFAARKKVPKEQMEYLASKIREAIEV